MDSPESTPSKLLTPGPLAVLCAIEPELTHLRALLPAGVDEWYGLTDKHEPWTLNGTWPEGIPHRTPRVIVGTVASADRWNRGHSRIRGLAGTHESLCEDMEAGAIALTSASHEVPFLTIKDISNNELLRSTVDSRTFRAETEGQLGKRAASLMLATLTELVEPARAWPAKA